MTTMKNLKGRGQSEDEGVNGRITLDWNFRAAHIS